VLKDYPSREEMDDPGSSYNDPMHLDA